MHCRYFDTTREAITLVFWHQQWLLSNAPSVWNLHSKVTHPHPFEKRWLRQISAYNVPTVRYSEEVQLWRIGSRPRAFRRAIDGVRSTLPLSSPKGGWKANFCFLKIQFNFNRTKSATKFLCVTTSSGKCVVYHSPIFTAVHRYWREISPFSLKFSLKLTHLLKIVLELQDYCTGECVAWSHCL